MHIELNTTIVRNADGSLAHTAVSLNDQGAFADCTSFGVCPGGTDLASWIMERLAEYPSPAYRGANTYRVARTRELTRDAE